MPKKIVVVIYQISPELLIYIPEPLQLTHAKCYTPESIKAWYVELDQLLQAHNIEDNPMLIWNADEARFFLCPKSGEILTLCNSKNVYVVTGDSKD